MGLAEYGASLTSRVRRLGSAEIWTGNERTASLLELPGLSVWVSSTPVDAGEAGGDIHYVSLCPTGTVSRVALADVSGHGMAVKAVSEQVRDLMQRYLASLGQSAFMRDLNVALQALDGTHYATMVALGWHSRRGLLVMTNAGHPVPGVFRADATEWGWLETRSAGELSGRHVGVALGLVSAVDYERRVIRPGTGDLVVLYSDGLTESTNRAGEELGRQGLMNMLRELDTDSAEALGTALTAAVDSFRDGIAPADDETIIVLQRIG